MQTFRKRLMKQDSQTIMKHGVKQIVQKKLKLVQGVKKYQRSEQTEIKMDILYMQKRWKKLSRSMETERNRKSMTMN